MAKLPPSVASAMLIPSLRDYLLGQGKVRDTYRHPTDPDKLVVVATDRLSMFDHVMPWPVSRKGEALTATTYFWLTEVCSSLPNHLVQVDMAIGGSAHEEEVNAVHELVQDFPDVPLERTLVVRKLDIMPYELIFRAHLGGSVWKQYQGTGRVAGVALPSGMVKWQELDEPLFTPSTKAETGHDVNITQEQFFDETGERGHAAVKLALLAYQKARQHALRHGIAILDTKFEVGIDELGEVVLADEVLTPDSSRYTTVEGLMQALRDRTDPPFHDKEPVREWGKQVATPFNSTDGFPIVGINNLDPMDEEHVAFIQGLPAPKEVISECTNRYLNIFMAISGSSVDAYQKAFL